jgi:anaerobic selenocysteine-containing dehydrogenase
MPASRREFLWTIGAATTGLGLGWTTTALWSADVAEGPGWTPELERRLNSTCLVCPGRCGISCRVVDGRLVRIIGNPLHPVSRGGLCPRGIAGAQMLYHPNRITTPRVRDGERGEGRWIEISFDEALDRLSERLGRLREDARPEALALLAGYGAGTMQDMWQQFLRAFGSPNYVADGYEDGMDAVTRLMHGTPGALGYDLERADVVLSVGAALFESWWSPLQAFTAYASPDHSGSRRGRFVQVDTRFSRTAARADEWIGIRPGTHAVLALGLAYVLLRDELYDASFVARHVNGFEDYTDAQGRQREGYRSLVLRRYRIDEVSAATGVPVERITALGRTLANSAAPLVVCGSDVTHAPNGLLAGLAVHSLNVLLGRVNRPGGVVLRDPTPVAALPNAAADATTRGGLAATPAAGGNPLFGNGPPPLRFAEAVASADGPDVDMLMLYYANPLASSPRPEVWRQAIGRIPFIVSFSPFLDETTRHADLVIPDALPYERWQDGPVPRSDPYPVWGVVRPVVAPPAGAVPTGEVLLRLASRLGGPVAQSLPFQSVEEVLRTRARGLFEARRGMLFGETFEREHQRAMQARGWWLPEHADYAAFWADLVAHGGWTDPFFDDTDPARLASTPSRRIELMPPALDGALRAVEPALALYIDVGPLGDEPSEEYPLRLIPYRVSTMASGTLNLERWLAERPGLFPEGHWVPWIEVAPHTAADFGLDDGAMAWVVSPQGRYRAEVRFFEGTAPDNVCAPYGVRHPDGELANPLTLLDGRGDPLTGLPAWHSTFVRLERAQRVAR